jgi:hypothetical protein
VEDAIKSRFHLCTLLLPSATLLWTSRSSVRQSNRESFWCARIHTSSHRWRWEHAFLAGSTTCVVEDPKCPSHSVNHNNPLLLVAFPSVSPLPRHPPPLQLEASRSASLPPSPLPVGSLAQNRNPLPPVGYSDLPRNNSLHNQAAAAVFLGHQLLSQHRPVVSLARLRNPRRQEGFLVLLAPLNPPKLVVFLARNRQKRAAYLVRLHNRHKLAVCLVPHNRHRRVAFLVLHSQHKQAVCLAPRPNSLRRAAACLDQNPLANRNSPLAPPNLNSSCSKLHLDFRDPQSLRIYPSKSGIL